MRRFLKSSHNGVWLKRGNGRARKGITDDGKQSWLTKECSKAQIEDCREYIKEHDPFGDEANRLCADAMIWCAEHCSETLFANAEVSKIPFPKFG